MAALDVILPDRDDQRATTHFANVNGRRYKYLYACPPNNSYRATCFLIHGWPDIGILAWRYQIPVLLQLGIRVVCPNMMGYGGTEVPRVPPESIDIYGQKRASDDIKELARQLGASRVILGGHDWGGEIVYRCALWHPNLVSHVFSVCTPFTAPRKRYVSLEEIIKRQSIFGYQQYLVGTEIEERVIDRPQIRQFLHGMFGARTKDGRVLFNPEKGLDLDLLPHLGKTKLLTDSEMDAYVEEMSQSGLHGTLNWYRTRKSNWKSELQLKNTGISVPVLYIQANRDNVLLPSLSAGMEKHIPNLSRREVNAGHWALWQTPEVVNSHIKEWIESVVFSGQSKI